MKNNILFYVCVPVYNVEKYLDICIQSVLGQTYQNFRLVLVDDGSPDRCSEICDQYAVQDNRIYVIHQSNMGLIAARQTAIRFVQQQTQYNQEAEPYIVTLDSDDSLKLNALQVAYDNITENNCDLLIFEYDRVSNGAVLEESADSPFYGTITNKNELYSIVLKKEGYNSLCRKIGKLSLYTEVDYSSFYHIKHSEDLLQSLELLGNAKRLFS